MRSAAGRLLALFVSALASLGWLAADAGAQEPLLQMSNLRVKGGASSWHAEPRFRLAWDQVPGSPAQAVVYRLSDPEGHLFGEPVRNTEALDSITDLRVPSVPGAYTVEAWLENREGQLGPPATATLRFDDTVPPAAIPRSPSGWVAGGKPVTIRVDHPALPYPLSGIAGYAVAAGRSGEVFPCAAVSWCSPDEIDLSGGIDDDSASLGVLPEGVSTVAVAAVSGSGVPSPLRTTEVRVDATPPAVALEGNPSGWSARPVQVTTVAHDELSGMAA